MNYRVLGRTGIRVSEVGLGCEGFVGKDEAFTRRVFDRAIECGVNCMDLYSPDPDLRERIGNVLSGRRDKFVLQAHLCAVWKDGQYKATRDPNEVRKGFDDLLTQLKTDYIDIGMIHFVDSVKTWDMIAEGEIMQYAQQLKKEGKIRCIGLSSHNPIAAQKAVESGFIDVLMFSVNPCYDLLPGDDDLEPLFKQESYEKPLLNMDPDREKLYETCQRLGVGITVMKAFGGGELLSDKSPAGKALTPAQCIHYALTRPGVAAVMSGVHSEEELEASLAYESASAQERDYASALASFPKISWKGHCMYCGHCAPCPKEIDIAAVTKYLNLAKAQGGVPETVREHYAALSHTALECIHCGQCETRCPFEVPVRENMKQAAEMFGR